MEDMLTISIESLFVNVQALNSHIKEDASKCY